MRALARIPQRGIRGPDDGAEGSSTHLAKLYAERTRKTLRRDLAELKNLGLVVVDGTGRFRAHVETIEAFLPARKPPEMPAPTVRQG